MNLMVPPAAQRRLNSIHPRVFLTLHSHFLLLFILIPRQDRTLYALLFAHGSGRQPTLKASSSSSSSPPGFNPLSNRETSFRCSPLLFQSIPPLSRSRRSWTDRPKPLLSSSTHGRHSPCYCLYLISLLRSLAGQLSDPSSLLDARPLTPPIAFHTRAEDPPERLQD